jgi:cell division protein FtsX
MDTVRREVEARPIERYQEPWVAWPVAWNAIWVGALAALAAALIIGLLGVALGAHELVPPRRVVRVRDFGFGAALFSVLGALLASGAEGWVASKIAGLHRAVASQARDAVNT